MAIPVPNYNYGSEDMSKVRLRPHHIVLVLSWRFGTAPERNDPIFAALFEPEFPIRLVDFVSQIPDDALVEVVSSNDDLCSATRCPYFGLCEAGSYRQAQDMMIAKAPADTPPSVTEKLRHSSPDAEDAKVCRNLGIKIGVSYKLRELYPTNESSATPS